jgi:DNA primase
MHSPVDKIKEKLSIVDVISSYVSVEQSGKNYKAKCPFHNEKTPSFYISPDRGSYYCFGCGAKGDIFSFVQHFEGTDFYGSLKLLAARAGIVLERGNTKETKDNNELLYDIMEDATKFFESVFAKETTARAYLVNRGLTDATIQSFRVGYAPDTWRSVSEHLLKIGYKREDIEKVGLIKSGEKGFYDRFRSRILFPIFDSSGRVIAFSGRIFGQEENTKDGVVAAKYLNSPDTPLFNKSSVLFGIDRAKSAIRTRGYTIIVEGQMDLLMSHQAGFTNTVAVSGTAFTENTTDSESKINNLGLIRRLSPNIIFAFDGDNAGIRAAGRASLIALSLEMQVKIAVLPEGQDPADIILENVDKWKEIIKTSVNIVSFHIDRICRNTTDIRKRGTQIRDIVFPFLSMVRSAIERSAYISEIYSKTSLAERAVLEDFETYERAHPSNQILKQVTKNKTDNYQSRRDHLEKRLFGIIFWQKENPDIQKLYEEFGDSIGQDVLLSVRGAHEALSDPLAFEAEMWYGGHTTALIRDVEEIILSLEEEILHERKLLLQPLDTQEKLVQFNTIVRRIEEIKSKRSK